ncbi:MAG: hypothetical protein JW874_00135 [Spirochaetales bacterium]|nr:hypothetical protein [Spirochaetales bacterium]
MKKTITIGGIPGIGKTTLSANIASALGCPCISVDDIAENLYTGCRDEKNNPFFDFRYYYNEKTFEELITATITLQEYIFNSVKPRIIACLKNKTPAVFEGLSIFPEFIHEIENDNLVPVWLVATDSLIQGRISADFRMEGGRTGTDEINRYFLKRSTLLNTRIAGQARKLNYTVLEVDENTSAANLKNRILAIVGEI